MIHITKSKIFLILCLAFVVSVGFRSVLAVPFWLNCSLIAAGFFIIVLFWQKKIFRVVAFCFLFIAFGIIRFELSLPSTNEHAIHFYNGQTVRMFGLVAAEPDVRQDHAKLTVKAVQVVQDVEGVENVPMKVSGRVLMKVPLYPQYSYGDLLDIKCQLQSPEPIEDFAYDRYLARYDIYSVCYRPTIELLAHQQGSLVMSLLLEIKSRFVQAIQSSLPEPQASFLGGLILGAKKSIPEELMQAFNRTGTTHIVALSGYNITIIAVMVANLCQHLWLSRKKSFWVALLAVTFFIVITGAQASVVRAGIMGTLVLLAQRLGRLSRITNALVLAAAVMLVVNPKVLAFDTGFQLSFLATLGLVYLSPIIEQYLGRLPSFFSLKENLIATLSAIIMTTPLILFQFGRLSLVAPLVNVLILPVIPLAMGFGFITGVLALLWLPLGQTFGWLVWAVLSYVLSVVETAAKLDFAAAELGNVNATVLVASYLLLVVFIFWRRGVVSFLVNKLWVAKQKNY